MALFKSSSKSRSTSNVTNNNIGFSEVSGLAVHGSDNVFTDQGAIAAAFDFANNQLAAQTSLIEGFGTVAAQSTGAVQTIAAQATKDQADNLTEIAKYAAIAIAVAYGLRAFRKK